MPRQPRLRPTVDRRRQPATVAPPELVAWALEISGLTVADFAADVLVTTPRTVYRYLAGDSTPRPSDRAQLVAYVLNGRARAAGGVSVGLGLP